MLPSVAINLCVTLDGFLAREDGRVDFLEAFNVGGEDYGHAAFMETVNAVVMGRATYDFVVSLPEWPFAHKRVVVLTRQKPQPAPRHNETFFGGKLRAILQRLGEEGITRVYLDGGIAVRVALGEGLVDEMTISTVPIVLGAGRALFGPAPAMLMVPPAPGKTDPPPKPLPESKWRVAASRTWENGLVQVRYVRELG
jgi:dihydrofolate reductase